MSITRSDQYDSTISLRRGLINQSFMDQLFKLLSHYEFHDIEIRLSKKILETNSFEGKRVAEFKLHSFPEKSDIPLADINDFSISCENTSLGYRAYISFSSSHIFVSVKTTYRVVGGNIHLAANKAEQLTLDLNGLLTRSRPSRLGILPYQIKEMIRTRKIQAVSLGCMALAIGMPTAYFAFGLGLFSPLVFLVFFTLWIYSLDGVVFAE